MNLEEEQERIKLKSARPEGKGQGRLALSHSGRHFYHKRGTTDLRELAS